MTTTTSLDLSGAIHRLDRRISFALNTSLTEDAKGISAVAAFLAREAGTVPARQLAARARAAARFMEVHRYA